MDIKFCGQRVSEKHLHEIEELISTFPLLSRTELANTVSELFSWKRPTGKLKTVECRHFLEQLAQHGFIQLPACKTQYRKKNQAPVPYFSQAPSEKIISAPLSELAPITLTRVQTQFQRQCWQTEIHKNHYLGFKTPFGAHLRYFIQSESHSLQLGGIQFSSPAWKIAVRDEWIGWEDRQRQKNLQKIICNSRFLIFPWVKVKNLASHVLSLAAARISKDWVEAYGYQPVLFETMVDELRFAGTCYKAGNWIYVGNTKGRGRMDRENKGQNLTVKKVFVYPLVKNWREELCGGY